jgi:hypothetical protein
MKKILYFIVISCLNIGLCLCSKIATAKEIAVAVSKYGVLLTKITDEEREARKERLKQVVEELEKSDMYRNYGTLYGVSEPDLVVPPDSDYVVYDLPDSELPKPAEPQETKDEILQRIRDEKYQTKYGMRMRRDPEWREKREPDSDKSINID